ncbi:MAG TPA: alpha/beta hydrolase-fold protein [Aggregatilineales bacterium]|nr:alpha/beta hydrolase-fold protein [Aggregatilineales bacterium]
MQAMGNSISTHPTYKPGTLDRVMFESRALAGNRLGDPPLRPLHVYLPPGYHDEPGRRYPAVLMLSSHGNTGQSMLNWRAWDESVNQQLDRLIGSAACPPCIMIIPDTWTRLGGALHVNSIAIGNYGDYLLDEIIPYVDAHYRTLPGGAHRGIMGRSSGGYAAIVHAMQRPGMFGAVADHSGDAYFEFMAMPEIARLHTNLMRYGGLDGLLEDALKNTPKSQAFYDAVSILTWAATHAPNPEEPHGFDLPIDMQTGALREDVWQRCLQADPVRMVSQGAYVSALRNLKELFIDCGQFDEYNLQVGARLLSRELTRLSIPHTYEEYPGGHRGTHYRYDVSLPRLVNALSEK